MKIKEVVGTNFGPFLAFQVDLDSRGLLLVQGQNNISSSADSNGSGKSYLLEAIVWCLYGRTIRGQPADKVINRKAKKDCRVQLTIEDGADTIVIQRGRKHSVLKNDARISINGTDVTRGTTTLTDAEIVRIIGDDYNTFVHSVLFDGNKIVSMPLMRDKEVKALIENALGVELFDKALEVVRAMKSKVNVELVDAQHNKTLCSTRLQDAATQSIDARNSATTWAAEHANRLAAARAVAGSVKPPAVDLATARTHRQECWDIIKGIEASLVAMKLGRPAVAPNLTQAEISLDRARNRKDAAALHLGIAQEPQAINRMVAGDSQSAQCLAEINAADAELVALRSAPAGKCPTCGQDVADTTAMAAHEAAIIARKGKAITAARARVAQVEAQLAAEIATWQNEVASCDLAITQATTQLANLQAQVVVFERDAFAIQLDEDALQRNRLQLAHTDLLISQADAYEHNLQTLQDRVTQIEAETNPHQATEDAAMKRAQELAQSLVAAEATVAAVERQAGLVGRLEALYGPKGLRVSVIEAATPLLNERANHYARALADGDISISLETFGTNAKGDKIERFTVNVNNSQGGESYLELSSGERRKVDIALALAFSDLVGARSNKAIDLWVADEIAESLDYTAQTRVVEVLKEIAARRGTALVVSHVPLSDMIPNALIVHKDKEGSSVRPLVRW